jgi:hypothetical protein
VAVRFARDTDRYADLCRGNAQLDSWVNVLQEFGTKGREVADTLQFNGLNWPRPSFRGRDGSRAPA